MGFFSSLTKMTMTLIETPVAVVKDVATLGGALTDQDTPLHGPETRRGSRKLAGRQRQPGRVIFGYEKF
jgi:hypothetical protein